MPHDRRRPSTVQDQGALAPRARSWGLTLLTGVLLALALSLASAGQASAALPLTPVPTTFNITQDENGADDQPGQKDLSLQGVATPSPGDLWTMWQWDDTGLSGSNTGDACSLFDNDNDGKVNFSVCVTIQNTPAVQAPVSPRVYTCGDGKVDRCTSTSTLISPINTACGTNTNATDPFHNGKKDTQAICHIALADVGGATAAKLVNTCSYPSQSPTSDPSDCVLIPRDAFVTIVKRTDVTDTTTSFPFNLYLSTDAAPSTPTCATTTVTGTCTSIAIRSGVAYTLTELVPTNWAIDTPAPSCTGASGTGASNGTAGTGASAATISGLKASSDNVITCTYYDKKLTGAIEITKLRSGTSIALAGAHFSIDGSGDYTTDANGKVCVAGLTLGNHTVTETTAPNGHTVDSTSPKTVNVASSGTCASGATTVTFNDPVVLGTITIHKTAGDMPLGGATFTLYRNNAPLAAPRGDATADPVTTKSCTTDATTGDCTITNVDLGDYWVVETTAPAGYTKAADKTVNVGVGTSPGVGDSDTVNFTDVAAPGTINIHKTGLNGGPLAGAVFTLYTRTLGETAHNALNSTGKTCTTNATGDCSITDVPPGAYWVVETTTPAGYDTADDTSVDVPLGSSAETGATVGIQVADPVVPGTVIIHKTGLNGGALGGATFTLYTDNGTIGGARTAADIITTKTCTTAAATTATTTKGDCTISNVPPGNYWAVETTTPAGYDTAPEQAFNVGVGTTAHVGDTDELTFADPVVNGSVVITKTDDANNALAGAGFTLYVNNAPTAGPRGSAAEDPATTKTCSTSAAGTCTISNVPPGDYWVVETTTPAHYETASDKAVTIGIGAAPHVGDSQAAPFVDPRKHRVVVLVCHEGSDTLFSRDVTVGGVTKQSLPAGSLSATAQKALCDTGGASFGDIAGHGHVSADVDLGTVSP